MNYYIPKIGRKFSKKNLLADFQGGNNYHGNNRERGYHAPNYDNRRDRDDYHPRGNNGIFQ